VWLEETPQQRLWGIEKLLINCVDYLDEIFQWTERFKIASSGRTFASSYFDFIRFMLLSDVIYMYNSFAFLSLIVPWGKEGMGKVEL
jgi:hypothetical protein